MAKNLVRSCPKCKGELEVVVPNQQREAHVSAINGRCSNCGYRLAWILIQGKRVARHNVHKGIHASRKEALAMNRLIEFFRQ